MTPFAFLSAQIRAIIALWALILCLVNIGSAVLAAARRRLRFIAYALVVFAPVYFLWQVIFDFSLFGISEKAKDVTLTLCGFAWILWLSAFVVLTFASVFLFARNIRYDKTFITPGAIKIFLDKIPCGVCCFRDNGRVLFSNMCMNELCEKITGGALLDGNHFKNAVEGGILTVGDKVWRFTCRDIEKDGENLQEIIASDITPEYAKTRMLEKDKAELSKLNRELRDYYDSIDEIVRGKEILQAKVNIHDEMNRLMLSTTAVNSEDTEELDRIFSMWEQDALLLCMEADEKNGAKSFESLKNLANALKINLSLQGEMPELSENRKNLFFSAANEAIINAFKHADAKNMKISFTETEKIFLCRFTNDGNIPKSEVKFTGGLSNLSALAKRQNAKISAIAADEFTLTLSFPKA
jgi:signal transduction histidine kinase